jgi:hypothetical protein
MIKILRHTPKSAAIQIQLYVIQCSLPATPSAKEKVHLHCKNYFTLCKGSKLTVSMRTKCTDVPRMNVFNKRYRSSKLTNHRSYELMDISFRVPLCSSWREA